jgi:hypothetical protein
MKRKNMVRFILHMVATIVIGITVVLPLWGQFPLAEGPTKERTRDDSERDLEERIAQQRMLASIAEKQRQKRDPKLALAELQEDFKRIQAVNLDMVRTLSKGGTLDLKFVANSADEIKKRAARLKTNLVLPESVQKENRLPPESVMNLEQLKRSMLTLGKSVYSFVKSPFFREIDVLNQEEGGKVRNMLDDIIELSERIKKNSENLRKN